MLTMGSSRSGKRAVVDRVVAVAGWMRDQARREIGAWPIRREKLSDLAAQRLEALIGDGTFPTGTMLPSERELMKIFRVGRTSIREALYALNRQGLIRLGT